MIKLSKPVRLLAFWPASDYEEFFAPAFLNRDDLEVEIVSGDRTSGPSPHAANGARLARLRQRVKQRDFDLIISGTIWNTAWPPHKGLTTRLAQAARFYTYKRKMLDTYWAPGFARLAAESGVPFATMDVRDPSFIFPWDWPLLREGFLYFKRELYHWPMRSLGPLKIYVGKEVEDHQQKLRPLSYGAPPGNEGTPNRPFAERDIDVFMSGMVQPLRQIVMGRLEALQTEFKIDLHRKVIPAEEYRDRLSRSKLVVCVESFGCETWRMYDASGSGAVPLINWPFVQNAFPLEPDKHALYFSYMGDHLERQIRSALADLPRLEKMSRATYEFTRQYKDRRAIANYVIETTLAEFQKKQQA